MKVKMKSLAAGPSGILNPGQVADVDDEMAAAFVAGGYAEEVVEVATDDTQTDDGGDDSSEGEGGEGEGQSDANTGDQAPTARRRTRKKATV